MTLGLFLSATRKGWKESIGFRDAELYVKSFEKIHSLKKIKYSRSSPGDFVCLFIYLFTYLFIYLFIYFLTDLKGKTFKVERQKILVSLITDEPVTAIMVLFWW